jgi:hypothetical protein
LVQRACQVKTTQSNSEAEKKFVSPSNISKTANETTSERASRMASETTDRRRNIQRNRIREARRSEPDSPRGEQQSPQNGLRRPETGSETLQLLVRQPARQPERRLAIRPARLHGALDIPRGVGILSESGQSARASTEPAVPRRGHEDGPKTDRGIVQRPL